MRPNAKFCDECGMTTAGPGVPAEYKQVTVLFADVVRSMDLAAAVGPERLREIMAELVTVCSSVIHRHGGTVDKFTGDGIMALFGAPKALEDHAVRACRAALEIQRQMSGVAAEVREHDGIELRLRVGLNSGQVIAGEIGSGPGGYTAIGEQVGMAQRMESAAPPGGVMLSASTARLVERSTVLGDTEAVVIKGSDTPVPAVRLFGMSNLQQAARAQSELVGREWEIGALTGLLSHATDGRGSVVGVVGPPGIGKSRITREIASRASQSGVEVAVTYCESHTSDIPFHAASGLLRAALGVEGLPDGEARQRVRSEFPGANGEDLLLVDDALGIADPEVPLPLIDPDARRRRLSALLNTASIARSRPVLYVIEDVHWVDQVSEAMLADFLAVIPRTRSLVVVTYRPEYAGVLSRSPRSQTITLEPLADSDIAALSGGMLGSDPSVTSLIGLVAERAGGNPFFAEELIRDFAEQGLLTGQRGNYVCTRPLADVTIPGTLQAVIASRIDRLEPSAKQTLNAAAVIGSRFTPGQLARLDVSTAIDDLVAAELIDQIGFAADTEYEFRHPLVRAVAYESQLAADRAQWHRRVADTLDQTDASGALIAAHLEAAGEMKAAYQWHMRAGAWSANRDLAAAQMSWEYAQRVADALSTDDPERLASRVAPRAMLCATSFRRSDPGVSAVFEEARALCEEAGDKVSLALVMSGLTGVRVNQGRVTEAAQLATEYMGLIEAIGDPALLVSMSVPASVAKLQALQTDDVLRWADAVIALADANESVQTPIVGSPLAAGLALRAIAGWAQGRSGWQDDLARATALMDSVDPMSRSTIMIYKSMGITRGVVIADDAALDEAERTLHAVERASDDLAVILTRLAYGLTLVHHPAHREQGYDYLADVRKLCLSEDIARNIIPLLDSYAARQSAENGGHADAIPRIRAAIEEMRATGNFGNIDLATVLLVETLLERGTDPDLDEAESAIQTWDDPIYDECSASREMMPLRLRTLLAHARGDVAAYRELKAQCRSLAGAYGFEGQLAWAEALPDL